MGDSHWRIDNILTTHLHQLARHWESEFDELCTLLAHSAVVHADETSWSLNSVWAFFSEKARVIFFGVHKDAAALKQILDPETFAGILISDDAAVYANFTRAQKCWAHLLRKAIKLTLQAPDEAKYRHLADRLLEIYREACRVQGDGRLGDTGRSRKVGQLEDAILELCAAEDLNALVDPWPQLLRRSDGEAEFATAAEVALGQASSVAGRVIDRGALTRCYFLLAVTPIPHPGASFGLRSPSAPPCAESWTERAAGASIRWPATWSTLIAANQR